MCEYAGENSGKDTAEQPLTFQKWVGRLASSGNYFYNIFPSPSVARLLAVTYTTLVLLQKNPKHKFAASLCPRDTYFIFRLNLSLEL